MATMQSKDRWRNQNDAGTQTDVLIEAINTELLNAYVQEPIVMREESADDKNDRHNIMIDTQASLDEELLNNK